MLHFSLQVNADTIYDVKIRNIGAAEDARHHVYEWSVTGGATRAKTIKGICKHDRADGALALASQVLHFAFLAKDLN